MSRRYGWNLMTKAPKISDNSCSDGRRHELRRRGGRPSRAWVVLATGSGHLFHLVNRRARMMAAAFAAGGSLPRISAQLRAAFADNEVSTRAPIVPNSAGRCQATQPPVHAPPRYSINRPSNARVPPVNGSAPRFPRGRVFFGPRLLASLAGSGPLRCLPPSEVYYSAYKDATIAACKRLSCCCEIQGNRWGAPGPPEGSPENVNTRIFVFDDEGTELDFSPAIAIVDLRCRSLQSHG